MFSERRLNALEKKIGPVKKPGQFHLLVVKHGQNRELMIEDFKKASAITSNDHLIVVQGVAPDRQEHTDEFQPAD